MEWKQVYAQECEMGTNPNGDYFLKEKGAPDTDAIRIKPEVAAFFTEEVKSKSETR